MNSTSVLFHSTQLNTVHFLNTLLLYFCFLGLTFCRIETSEVCCCVSNWFYVRSFNNINVKTVLKVLYSHKEVHSLAVFCQTAGDSISHARRPASRVDGGATASSSVFFSNSMCVLDRGDITSSCAITSNELERERVVLSLAVVCGHGF